MKRTLCLLLLLFPTYLVAGPQPKVVLSVNPLGYLTFGPTVDLDISLIKNLSLSIGVRDVTKGRATDQWLDEAEDSNVESGITRGASIRYYINPQNSLEGLYLGGHIEAGEVESETLDHDVIALAFEHGHRWFITDRFTLDLGGQVGELATNYREKKDDNIFSEDNSISYFIFQTYLSVGVAS